MNYVTADDFADQVVPFGERDLGGIDNRFHRSQNFGATLSSPMVGKDESALGVALVAMANTGKNIVARSRVRSRARFSRQASLASETSVSSVAMCDSPSPRPRS